MLLRRDRAMTAVSIVLDVAFHAGRGTTVPAGDIADRLGEARRGIEPVLQALSRAGILSSTRGPKGGYRLGRAARGQGRQRQASAMIACQDACTRRNHHARGRPRRQKSQIIFSMLSGFNRTELCVPGCAVPPSEVFSKCV